MSARPERIWVGSDGWSAYYEASGPHDYTKYFHEDVVERLREELDTHRKALHCAADESGATDAEQSDAWVENWLHEARHGIEDTP